MKKIDSRSEIIKGRKEHEKIMNARFERQEQRYQWHAEQGQDEYAYNLLGENGYFLDIGAGHLLKNSNTYCLEKYGGWKGLLFDETKLGPVGRRLDRDRRHSKFFNVDVTTDEFVKIMERESERLVDYVSIDVECASLQALKNLISSGTKFKFMTFEHNFYIGKLKPLYWEVTAGCFDDFRKDSREILKREGYFLLHGDVQHRGGRFDGESFEDWWVSPQHFDEEVLNKESYDSYWTDILGYKDLEL
jgi:hypothetical protein